MTRTLDCEPGSRPVMPRPYLSTRTREPHHCSMSYRLLGMSITSWPTTYHHEIHGRYAVDAERQRAACRSFTADGRDGIGVQLGKGMRQGISKKGA